MKFRMLALILMIALILTACSNSKDGNENLINVSTDTSSDSVMRQEVRYIKEYIDFKPYDTIEDIISRSDIVVVGEVTDISFMTHDDMTDPPPLEKEDKVLCTVYDLNILNVYKGKVKDTVKLKMNGGLENEAYTDEQLFIWGDPTIPICDGESTFEIGQRYLLVLQEFKHFAGFYHPVGWYQGVYPIDDTLNILERDENSLVFSAKNVISYFGEDQWSAFKTDNHITTE